jgi:hypothetical protein
MNVIRLISILTVASFLTACGGGSSNQSQGPGPSGTLTMSAESTSVQANPRGLAPDPNSPHTVQVSVRFTNPTGGLVQDGTTVLLSSSSVPLGVVSPVDDPDNTGSTATSTTASGFARFWFTAGSQTGTVNLNASASDPASGQAIATSLQLTITPYEGDPDPSRVQITVNATDLPANTLGFEPAVGSPFSTQVNVEVVTANGSPAADGTEVNLGVNDTSRAVVSPLDSPLSAGGSATAQVAAGSARFLLTSATQEGLVELVASFTDDGGEVLLSDPRIVTITAPVDPSERISIQANDTSLPANILDLEPSVNSLFSTQVNVTLLGPDGSPAADGSQVSLGVDNVSRARIAPADEPLALAATATTGTVAGVARFLLTTGRQEGPVNLIASTTVDGAAIVSEPLTIMVLPNNVDSARLTISGDSTMPTNPQGVPIFFGSPFINELTIEYTGIDGNPGDVEAASIAVAVAPVFRGAFSTLDDPDTEDVNEFEVLIGAGPVTMTASVATIFIHSFDRPGPLTVTVIAVDASTGERFTAKFDVEMIDGAADFLPAQIDFSVGPEPVYVQGAGGATVKSMQLFVRDSGGNAVPNPEADGVEWNNVHLELIAPAGSDARLTGTGSEGSVSGTEISVQSVNGIVNFALNSGSESGPHRVIATVDRSDNNVDVGILDPLRAEMTVEVGDGRLHALTLVSPILNAIRVNRTTTGVETSFEPFIDPVSGALVPPDPDGTYSFTVTVQGTDKVGNPVLPGTQVNFGKIDDPLTGYPRFFVFSGPDGNPQEGGTLFSVWDPQEGFLDDPLLVDEAVEPGDTVALFGKVVPGNREHEAVRFVESVIDDRRVVVTQPFNPNNQTGNIVDDGYVIPWVIGRSQIGMIDHNVNLNAQGRGSVQLTYPISAIGRPVVLWSQGVQIGTEMNKTVADVESIFFPAVEPLSLTAQPSAIQANGTSSVRLCLTDGLGSHVNGVNIWGQVAGGTVNGQLDGQAMTTATAAQTGTAGPGCVDTQVTVSGMVPADEPATLRFWFREAFAEVLVAPPGAARLLVNPSRITDPTLALLPVPIELTLLNADGSPIAGVPLQGTCDGGEGTLIIETAPGITDANGKTTTLVLVGMSACGDGTGEGWPRFGQCEFSPASGEPPVGYFTAIGNDGRLFGASPSPACPPLEEEEPDTATLQMEVDDLRDPVDDSLITSIPAGISCDASGAGANCEATFPIGTVVTLRAPTGTAPTWQGACEVDAGDPRFASVEITATGGQLACLAEFN